MKKTVFIWEPVTNSLPPRLKISGYSKDVYVKINGQEAHIKHYILIRTKDWYNEDSTRPVQNVTHYLKEVPLSEVVADYLKEQKSDQ